MAERHGDVRFEPTDVRIGPIVGFLVILLAALIAVMFLLWVSQRFELGRAQMRGATIAAKPPSLPPEPRIEGVGLDQASHSVTNADLASSARSQRQREDQMLADGWTDAGGKKHPPIKDAMKRLIEEVKKNAP